MKSGLDTDGGGGNLLQMCDEIGSNKKESYRKRFTFILAQQLFRALLCLLYQHRYGLPPCVE